MKTSELKRAKWEQEVAAFRASGLTQAAYARRRSLTLSTLNYWLKKLGAATQAQPAPSAIFVPVEVRQEPTQRRSAGGESVGCPVAVLTYGDAELVIDAAVSPQWVAALLREVGGC